MEKKLFALAFVTAISSANIFAQSTDWNGLNKYWYYRYRLVDKFLIRGEESPLNCGAGGYSIPATAIEAGDDVNWGDGTVRLGWYIGTLATEYKLLSLNNQPTEATKRELYYAMKAYERLDRKVERIFYPHDLNADCSDPYLNGLFARDDIDDAFVDAHPEFKAKFQPDDINNFTYSSDHKRHRIQDPNDKYRNNVYPSQDQVSHLFLGFALVKNCLPPNENYQGYNFFNKAELYVDKITSRLDNKYWFGRLENGDIYENGKTFRQEGSAYGLAKAAEWISGYQFDQSKFGVFSELPLAISEWQAFADPFVDPINMSIFDLMWANKVDFTIALLESYAAIGNSWHYGFTRLEKKVGIRMPAWCHKGFIPYPCMKKVYITCYQYELKVPRFPISLPSFGCFPRLPELSINITSESLSYFGNRFGQQFYPLLHEYLYDESSTVTQAFLFNAINSAPCEGPHHKPDDASQSVTANGWRGRNRWERPQSGDGFVDIEDQESYGRFNGLDYMLFYNLYLLTRGQNDGINYKNMLNTVSSNNLVTGGRYWSYESMELSGMVPNNVSTTSTPVEIVSNNSIVLKPGFNVQPGVNARIYIDGNLTACSTSQDNTGSLRMPKIVEKDDATLEREFQEGIAAKLQKKLNAISEEYVNNPVYSYKPLDEYLKNNDARTATKNNASKAEWTNRTELFPNPANHEFYLEIYLKESQKVNVTIRSIYGDEDNTIFAGSLNAGMNRLKFDIHEFNKGIFTVEIKGEYFHNVQRLIKRN